MLPRCPVVARLHPLRHRPRRPALHSRLLKRQPARVLRGRRCARPRRGGGAQENASGPVNRHREGSASDHRDPSPANATSSDFYASLTGYHRRGLRSPRRMPWTTAEHRPPATPPLLRPTSSMLGAWRRDPAPRHDLLRYTSRRVPCARFACWRAAHAALVVAVAAPGCAARCGASQGDGNARGWFYCDLKR